MISKGEQLYLYDERTKRCLKFGAKIGHLDTFNRELRIGDVVSEVPSRYYNIVTDRYNTWPASYNGTITNKETDNETIEQAYKDWPQYYIVTMEECLKLKELHQKFSDMSKECRSKTFERIKGVQLMTIEEYNRLATDIALRIGQHIVADGSHDDEYVKALKQRAEKLNEIYWRDNK